jgi:hypothetical protein
VLHDIITQSNLRGMAALLHSSFSRIFEAEVLSTNGFKLSPIMQPEIHYQILLNCWYG